MRLLIGYDDTEQLRLEGGVTNPLCDLYTTEQGGRGQAAAGIRKHPEPEVSANPLCHRPRVGYLLDFLRRRLVGGRQQPPRLQPHDRGGQAEKIPDYPL